MESFENSNRHSMSDSLSLYERYMRSFNVVDNYLDHNSEEAKKSPSNHSEHNIDLSAVQVNASKHTSPADDNNCFMSSVCNNLVDKDSLSSDLELKADSNCVSSAASLENISTTVDSNEKSNFAEVHVSIEESVSNFKQPVFITSTMENSNNAVDSVPLFGNARHNENVFKLPISELSFNGTILKHVQKLKPIVDPITALSASNELVNLDDKNNDILPEPNKALCDKYSDNTGESQYEECIKKNQLQEDGFSNKWSEQSYSSLEASFDSGVRSPDMFSEDENDSTPAQETLWSFIKNYEAYDKRRVKKIEETLQGIPPPPSITTLKIDVNEILKKYYCFLPAFNDDFKHDPETNSMTPTKKMSYVYIPEKPKLEDAQTSNEGPKMNTSSNDTSLDKSVEIKMCTETEAKQTVWPDVLKCKYYDVYYNVTNYSEKFELLSLRYGERYVGAETDTSVNVHSGGLQSPNSASKRKALRLKLAQAKSPGSRLSHLARRRQAFCSAATISEKAKATSKMVLIDKKKLVNSSERRSPRLKRTPSKITPSRKTPRKTPMKTPKTGSSRKKAMRRLLLDPENLTRSQPTRETSKRALFISPENRKPVPVAPCTSMPLEAMKSKRCLFGSPVGAETKSSDGTQSDTFLKRKRDPFDDDYFDNGRSKIAKSLSFGGNSVGKRQSLSQSFSRRASECFPNNKTMADLNEVHKKKLLWAVTEALRIHGWRMCSPGFKEKASSLARLTRRLLTLPQHAAKMAATKLSTSDTLLRLARQYVFAIIQGRSVEDCFQEEQAKLANDANSKISGYISATKYQQMKAKQATSTFTSQIKENTYSDGQMKPDQPRSGSKNVLQDKTVNIDANSNSSSGLSALERMGHFKSNSMPSFEEAAKMRARRQISFDTVEFKR